MIWNEVNLISIHRLYCHLVSEQNNVMLVSSQDQTRCPTHIKHLNWTSQDLQYWFGIFDAKDHSIAVFFRFCFKLNVVAPDVIMIALQLQPIEFAKRGRKKYCLDLWLRWASECGQTTGEIWESASQWSNLHHKANFYFFPCLHFSISSGIIALSAKARRDHMWWHSYSHEETRAQRIPRNYWPNYSDWVLEM